MRNACRFLALLTVVAALSACDFVQTELLANSPGEKTYRRLCAECHGVDGSGNTPRYMGNAAADLLDDSWDHGGGDRGSLEMVIREGIFAKMPAHPELTPEEMRELIDHVLALRGEV